MDVGADATGGRDGRNQRVVVIGAGIVGNSLAYHLTRLGVTDITLVDKGPLPNPGGSTGHASNFIFPVDHSKEMTSLTLESMRQYKDLDVFIESGGIEIARTEERMQELTRRMASAKSWGIEPVELLTPDQVKDLVPYIDEQLILGGFYTPGAGVVDSLRAGTIMRERAVEAGMTVQANTEVLDIGVEHGRVKRVRTTKGDLEADLIVIACGAWSPRIAGASIPLTPMVHQMIDIGPAPRFANTTKLIEYPIVRDMDTNMYERQEGTGLEIGSYAHRPITLDADEIPSIEEAALSPTELPFTQQDFDPQMEQALELMPEIVGDETVGVKYAINGVLSVTYDGMPLLGETPEVKGLWSAAAIWIKEGPGAGKTLAELIVHGESEIDVYESNIARAYPSQRTRTHIVARACEGFNKMYGIVHPSEQWASDRNVRLSPFHERERDLKAVFYEGAGWERPHWYESNAGLLDEYGDRIATREAEWDSRWWSPIINAEHLAMRDRAAMMITPFLLMGAMSPVSLPATLVQQVAEALAGIALSQLIRPGAPVVFGSFLSNTDMQSGSPSFGTPESGMGVLCTGQIARRFGLPWRGGGGLNASQTVDAQAAYESLMTMLPTFLAGTNFVMHAAGWLEGGLVSCYEKFIVDVELLRELRHEFTPLEIDDASLAYDAHVEVGPGGHFLGAAHTLERFRECFYRPLLSSTENFDRWSKRGAKDTTARANEIWRATLERYEQPPLDDAIRAELEEFVVCRRAELGD